MMKLISGNMQEDVHKLDPKAGFGSQEKYI